MLWWLLMAGHVAGSPMSRKPHRYLVVPEKYRLMWPSMLLTLCLAIFVTGVLSDTSKSLPKMQFPIQ
jgi:hypothetical protein